MSQIFEKLIISCSFNIHINPVLPHLIISTEYTTVFIFKDKSKSKTPEA